MLASAGRIEIVGGAFYEPILTMISTPDRIGQIARYSEWLTERFGTPINGMWMPERVWEQSLTRDIATAGIRYTLLGRLSLQKRRPRGGRAARLLRHRR